MTQEIRRPIEETLDPENWESVRALSHQMLDDILDYMATIRERPAWQHFPQEAKARLNAPLPLDPQPLEEVYGEFVETVLPYPVLTQNYPIYNLVIVVETAE